MVESYFKKKLNSCVGVQGIHICKANKVLIKQILSIYFAFLFLQWACLPENTVVLSDTKQKCIYLRFSLL